MTTLLAARPPLHLWKSSPAQWGLLALALGALVVYFYPALVFMVATWRLVEEYSYGWFVPVITAFLIWQRSDQLREHPLHGSWWGLPVLLLGLALGALGHLSAIRVFSMYGFVVAIFGVALATIGTRGTRILAVPLGMLLLMIPLPQFLLREVSHSLQLLSSQLGVLLIRGFGISVFLEGNVIDLGSYKLQVVEACNGLRYLFPLMVLGCLAAYCFKAPLWKRWLLVLSTIPLTIAINSLRIGLIGVTVEHWGVGMAEGILHDLEGWFMFLICLTLLFGEMALMAWMAKPRQSLMQVFALDPPAPAPQGAQLAARQLSRSAQVALGLVTLAAALTVAVPASQQVAPARQAFTEFPLQLAGGWQGVTSKLEPDIVATLALTDYFLGNYTQGPSTRSTPWVNFYTAYYASQSGGESSHSPRTCIPGDGWAILKIEDIQVPLNGSRLPVTRALIQRGENRHLVYFWFRQRGQNLTGEMKVKWNILYDSVVRDRSDGALIRLITPVLPGEDPALSEQRLTAFVQTLSPQLNAFIPD